MRKKEVKAPTVSSLYDLTPAEMESFILSIGEKKYRARQMLAHLYNDPVTSFDDMTTFSVELRRKLESVLTLAPLQIRTSVESPDGSVKHAYEAADDSKALLESVWMPSEAADGAPLGGKGTKGRQHKRNTLCVSSQLGCAAGCRFCATGKLGLQVQLTSGQIVYQVIHTLIMYKKLPDAILFMGMGEPMHNYEAVESAIEILTHPRTVGLSQRRIVVSTAGELERMGALARKFKKIRLAISLNAATDDVRNNIMPLNKRFDLRAIRAFIHSTHRKTKEKITLEYVVLKDVNDTWQEEQALVRYLKPLAGKVKVNLIPYNPVKGIKFNSPDPERVKAIQRSIKELGIKVFIRKNRGRDSLAACGQLSGQL